jgi:peptidoglycan/xylan/chitin deacetylase (PgdA/CDA1 family)
MVLLTGCAQGISETPGILEPALTASLTSTLPPSTGTPSPTVILTWTLQPTETRTPTLTPQPTATLSLTNTPAPTASSTWAWTEAGRVVAPILLYHHIAENGEHNRYYVSPENFRLQMQALHDWGYSSITPAALVDVLMHGGILPPRPVVITFDDGNLDVYTTAFPMMQELGFVGAFYIVGNRLGADGYVNAAQLQEMIAAGWEIGSHSMTHADLTRDLSTTREEILQSRLLLERALGIPVRILAYPFGLVDEYILTKTQDYGYLAGMGLGMFNEHTISTLYYLSRREVHYEYDQAAFEALLPWSEP